MSSAKSGIMLPQTCQLSDQLPSLGMQQVLTDEEPPLLYDLPVLSKVNRQETRVCMFVFARLKNRFRAKTATSQPWHCCTK